MKHFIFFRKWSDLDRTFFIGEIISLTDKQVEEVQERIKKYGEIKDLVRYGKYSIPFTFLKPFERKNKK